MPKSNKQIMDETLAYLDTLTPGQGDFELATLRGVDKYVLGLAKVFLDRAKDNIRKNNLISSGDLESQLTFDVTYGNKVITLSLGYPQGSSASKYYDFVNKGVRGFTSGSPSSKYSFKNPYPNRKMAANIFSWINKNRIRDKYEANVNKTAFGKKRASLTKSVSEAKNKRKLAYAMAAGIKKKGIRKSRFFDEAIDFTFGQEFAENMARIYGKAISVSIKSTFNGNNNQ